MQKGEKSTIKSLWSFIQTQALHNTISIQSGVQLIPYFAYSILYWRRSSKFKRNRSASH